MGDAVAALGTGYLFDRHGPAAVAVLPVIAAVAAALAFTDTTITAVAGSPLWGAAVGVQESTLRATVAHLVPAPRRATAYGIYAAVIGAGTFAGRALTGALYDYSIPVLVGTIAVVQAGALVLLALTPPPAAELRTDRSRLALESTPRF
jgi:MFS-type transporter involved in bile tolerance (Atg22 family)